VEEVANPEHLAISIMVRRIPHTDAGTKIIEDEGVASAMALYGN
jgi:hypothetical protein